MKTVGQLVSLRTRADISSPNNPIELEKIHHTFGQQLSALRNLLNAGSRESTFFSARLSNYNAFLVSLTNLFQAGFDVGRHTVEPLFLGHLQYETESLLAAIFEEFDVLTGSHPPGEKLCLSQMNAAFAVFEEKVNKIRDQGVWVAEPLETLSAFAGHFAVLRSLRDELNNIRSAMEGLPRFDQPLPRPTKPWRSLPEAKPHWDFLPTIDWFWVKVGIKGGLAAVISIVFLKWIHPPWGSEHSDLGVAVRCPEQTLFATRWYR